MVAILGKGTRRKSLCKDVKIRKGAIRMPGERRSRQREQEVQRS